VVSCAKTAEPIKMLFELGIRMGPRNHALDESPDRPMRRCNFYGIGHAEACPSTLCHELCKMAEAIEIPFGLWTRVGPEGSMY